MRAHIIAAAIATATLTACSISNAWLPDPAIGTYDKQTGGEVGSANCGADRVTNGRLYLSAEYSWTKVDIHRTPGGSSVCGYIGGTWKRIDETTLELTPSQLFSPRLVTVSGNDLAFENGEETYKRRMQP